MTAEKYEPSEVTADSGETRHLRVVQALPKGFFDNSFYIQPKWLIGLQPISPDYSWRVDSNSGHPEASWVNEHSMVYDSLVAQPVREAVA